MKIVKLKGKNYFAFNESHKQLPINRYTDFQKYVLQDAGIGSELADVDTHFKKLDTFLTYEQLEEARIERYNLHMNMYLMINKINIEQLSFACLVHSINGEDLKDFSEENLKKVCNDLGEMGLTQDQMSSLLKGVKKNLIRK